MNRPSWTETDRLAALDRYRILDSESEQDFDDVVALAAELLQAPMAAVNLIARDRQWFKSEIGLGVREMPLADSICRHALFEADRMVIADTMLDDRFNCNPLVTGGPGLRFYAGELLKTPDGIPLGTLCVLDTKARPQGLSPQQAVALRTLARQVMTRMELRKLVSEQDALLRDHRHTAEELRRERDRAYQLFRGMDEGFVHLDRAFRIREISPGGLRMDGRGEQDIVGLTHWEAWPGSADLPVGQAIRDAMASGRLAALEQLYVFPDGRRFWLDVRLFPAEDGLAMFYRDITQRKDAERTLRDTAERLEFTLEAARIGDWHLDLVNDEAHRSLRHDLCFGYPEPIPEWGFQTFIAHVHPDDRAHVRAAFERTLSQLVDWHFECRVIWPDGSVHWIAAHGSVSHAEARPTRMSGIVYDISDRRWAEEALRDSEQQAHRAARLAEQERQRLDAVLEAAPVGIVVADAAGRIVQANAENRKLWGAPHVLWQTVDHERRWRGWWADGSDRTGRELQPHEWALPRALASEESPRQVIEIAPLDAPQQRRIILNSGAAVRDAAGVIVGAVATQMDITERTRAESALRDADRRKDEFLAMLAHELRNPLAPITSAAHILSSSRIDAQRAAQFAAIISRQARHMTALIDDLLDVSRVTRGLTVLNKEPVDLKGVISTAVEQARPLLEKHRHALSLHLSSAPSQVLGDRERLVQVVANLLNNAAKYTPDGGSIQVSLETSAEVLTVAVRDTGVGMSRELIEQAFELFTQAERSSDRTQGGLGIGLALVRSLATLHGGQVAAHSDGPSKGSTFTVTLPRQAPAPTAAWPQPAPQVWQPLATPLRVQVVDDNEDAAMTLGAFLESRGHEVCVCYCAAEALERASAFRPDVAILDIGMPEMDGFELARRLRGASPASSPVLLALTGYGQDHDRQEALAAGFDHHLVKPVELDRLERLLHDVSRRPQEKD
ncbi:MAG TPA: ATP-binding protein [Ramlibacter sp.]